MTKKHFEAIAAILKLRSTPDYPDGIMHCVAEGIAEDMADYFATVNSNFDRQRFLSACGF